MGRGGVSYPGMWGMGSHVSTVRVQGPSSGAPGHPQTSGQPLRTGCDKTAVWLSGLMVLPWPQHLQTGVQSVLEEPAADMVFPSVELAGGDGWKAGCTQM